MAGPVHDETTSEQPTGRAKQKLAGLLLGAVYGSVIVVIGVQSQIVLSQHLQDSLMAEHSLSEARYVDLAAKHTESRNEFLRFRYSDRILHPALGCSLAAFLVSVTIRRNTVVKCLGACPILLITLGWSWSASDWYKTFIRPQIVDSVEFMAANRDTGISYRDFMIARYKIPIRSRSEDPAR